MISPEDVSEKVVEESGDSKEVAAVMVGDVPPSVVLPEKTSSNIFTLLLIIALVFVLVSIYLVCYELNAFYNVTFGGILSESTPVETVIPEE